MRKLVKCGQNSYVEVDTDTEKAVSVIMTRDEAYSYLNKRVWPDLAIHFIDEADREYAQENAEVV